MSRTAYRSLFASLLSVCVVLSATGCGGSDTSSPANTTPTPSPSSGPTATPTPTPTPNVPQTREVVTNFAAGLDRWDGDFADLPANYDLPTYETDFRLSVLPAPLDTTRQSALIQSHNRSDDLFMFVRRRVDGLAPNTLYEITFDVAFASNAPTASVGVGGGPGASVYVRGGATTARPGVTVVDGYLRPDFDPGNQAQPGRDGANLGITGIPGEEFVYQLKQLAGAAPRLVQTDAQGQLWLFVGFDSGFEGKSVLYLTQIRARLIPR